MCCLISSDTIKSYLRDQQSGFTPALNRQQAKGAAGPVPSADPSRQNHQSTAAGVCCTVTLDWKCGVNFCARIVYPSSVNAHTCCHKLCASVHRGVNFKLNMMPFLSNMEAKHLITNWTHHECVIKNCFGFCCDADSWSSCDSNMASQSVRAKRKFNGGTRQHGSFPNFQINIYNFDPSTAARSCDLIGRTKLTRYEVVLVLNRQNPFMIQRLENCCE